MELGVLKETLPDERRVALVPESVAALRREGWRVVVEEGAGEAAGFGDMAYAQAGAEVAAGAERVLTQVRVIVRIHPPARRELELFAPGHVLVGLLAPLRAPDLVGELSRRRVTCFSLDLLPRTTRAQEMDVLTSMSTVAGYRAALLAAQHLPRFMPLLMTAAGTVRPARVLVLGAGVAGLQAIATCRRLGAVVEAYDARPEVREQVESLGAKFVGEAIAGSRGEGGYARALGAEELARERALLADAVRQADAVITTAQVPGGRAPVLVTEAMVAAMRPGSVIVDLAAESGGNCELTVPGEAVRRYGVTILGPVRLPATLPQDASVLFSRNLTRFLRHLAQVAGGPEGLDIACAAEDEILGPTLIAHAGQVLHPQLKKVAG